MSEKNKSELKRGMKIGPFSEFNQIPKDTIRYYMKEGLLNPKLQGAQVVFGQTDQEDLDYIKALKEMRFTIGEIRSFLYMKRMSGAGSNVMVQNGLQMFQKKQDELLEEQKSIAGSLRRIEEELRWLRHAQGSPRENVEGVPIAAIPLLCCPDCRKPLMISNAEISRNSVIEGELSCTCGYGARIHEGIVETPNRYEGSHDTPDLTTALYHETGPEWSRLAPRCAEYVRDRLKSMHLEDKTILEANINGFSFIYNFMSDFPRNGLYILVDKYPEVLRLFKREIETLYEDASVLYIADAGERYPVADGAVDVFVTFFGENEYSFYHRNAQIHDIRHLLGDEAQIVGAYINCGPLSPTRRNLTIKYPEGNPDKMDLDALRQAYREAGFILESDKVGDIASTIKHHMFTEHVEGDLISLHTLYGRMAGITEKDYIV